MANEKRLIDANALMERIEERLKNEIIIGWLCSIVDEAPTVDAVEVVRCKDCKSHHWEQEPCHGKTVHICSKLNAEVTRDFYCAAGERKDND